jgi:hypothetical protein
MWSYFGLNKTASRQNAAIANRNAVNQCLTLFLWLTDDD